MSYFTRRYYGTLLSYISFSTTHQSSLSGRFLTPCLYVFIRSFMQSHFTKRSYGTLITNISFSTHQPFLWNVNHLTFLFLPTSRPYRDVSLVEITTTTKQARSVGTYGAASRWECSIALTTNECPH